MADVKVQVSYANIMEVPNTKVVYYDQSYYFVTVNNDTEFRSCVNLKTGIMIAIPKYKDVRVFDVQFILKETP